MFPQAAASSKPAQHRHGKTADGMAEAIGVPAK
jgi:hypothetical protein